MSDGFLSQCQREPRTEFARRLYQRISQQPEPTRHTRTALRLAALSFSICLTLFVALFAASPVVRAKVVDAIRRIGGLNFHETQDYPISATLRVLTPESFSLEQALQKLPFSFALPGWVPEGYHLEEQVQVAEDISLTYIRLTWRSPQQRAALYLQAEKTQENYDWGTLVGTGSVEEVRVNDQPAALVHGSWNGQTRQWDIPELIDLVWQKEDVTYHLQTIEGSVSIENLTRMAESIP